MLKVDLHVHSRLSKSFEFEQGAIGKLKDLGIRRGLDGFALTEHIHANDFWQMTDQLRSSYRYQDHYFDLEGFRMFSGCEVTVDEGVDFIVVGDYQEIRDLDASWNPRLSEANFVPGVEFLTTARGFDLLVLCAHPFRPGQEADRLPLKQLFGLVDGIEVNGRDHGTEEAVASLGREYGLALAGGSDAHYYLQAGIRSTMVPGGELTLDGIRGAFARHQTRAHCKPYAQKVVELCEEMKKLAKRRQEHSGLAIVAA